MAKKHHEVESGSEGWLVSYCDMISLLVTFFLMMMTFSTSKMGDVTSIGVGLLRGRGGIFNNMLGHVPTDGPPPEVLERLAIELDELRRGEGPEAKIGLEPELDGLAILFGESCSFAPGSAEVNADLRASLGRVAQVLERNDHLIVVEGFTDSEFKPTPAYPSAAALSASRAFAAARAMMEGGRLASERVQVAALGMQRPRIANDSALARTLNRRVEVRMLSVALKKRGAPPRPDGR